MFFVFLHFFLSFLVRNSSVSSSDNRERLPPLEIWGLIDGIFAWKRCLRNIVSNLWYIARSSKVGQRSWLWRIGRGMWAFRNEEIFWMKILNQEKLFKSVRNVPYNSENEPRGLYFSNALFEELIFGGAYIPRGLSTEGNLRFKIDWASLIVGSKFTVLPRFTLYLRAVFQNTSPRGLIIGGAI